MKPPPPFTKDGKVIDIKFSRKANELVEKMIGPPPWQDAQIFWLANVPYSHLNELAFDVYKSIDSIGRSAYIPIDNWRRAEREAHLRRLQRKQRVRRKHHGQARTGRRR